MPETDYVQVSSAIDAQDGAAQLAKSAVRARLAACAQVVGPIESTYRWDGEVTDATEWLVLFKTTAERCEALIDHLRGSHPYDVPEIIATQVIGGNPAYLAWIGQETRPM